MLTLTLDERRELIVPGDETTTLQFCLTHFISLSQQAIDDHGAFYVALSGGSTPKAIFQQLTSKEHRGKIAWDKVHLFWSDERTVAPTHPDSNYTMAMDAGLKNMTIPPTQIHRMVAEKKLEENAKLYEESIHQTLQKRPFDLIMLGMGEDGHTASLFPHTAALKVQDKLVTANFIPQKNCWRMTLSYACINQAAHIALYVIGAGKKEMLARVLLAPDQFEDLPSQKIGTKTHKALWIADAAAAALLLAKKGSSPHHSAAVD
jgi:6-phosphogluconolactonase